LCWPRSEAVSGLKELSRLASDLDGLIHQFNLDEQAAGGAAQRGLASTGALRPARAS
jgi:hypothetical protein